ncbi:MAG: hypothetical protein AAGF68_00195 [Pseudomonadota bacterium]
MRIILGFLACVVATALVLIAAHGASHLTVNPSAVAVVLCAIAMGLCLAALIVTGILRLTTGTAGAQSWWPSLIVITVIALGGLYLIETTTV